MEAPPGTIVHVLDYDTDYVDPEDPRIAPDEDGTACLQMIFGPAEETPAAPAGG